MAPTHIWGRGRWISFSIPNIDDGTAATEVQIPTFLLLGDEFDEWESIDSEAEEVVLLHNLNRVIAENRTSGVIAPLF